MRSRRISPFAVGQRWLCDRSKFTNHKVAAPSFYFVIIGHSLLRPNNIGLRRCRIWVIGHETMTKKELRRWGHGVEYEYTTTHLQEHGVWCRPSGTIMSTWVPATWKGVGGGQTSRVKWAK